MLLSVNISQMSFSNRVFEFISWLVGAELGAFSGCLVLFLMGVVGIAALFDAALFDLLSL